VSEIATETLEVFERVACGYCDATEGHPCQNLYNQPVAYYHASRRADYIAKIQYDDSLWQMSNNNWADRGLPTGKRFIGYPYGLDKRLIRILSWEDSSDENLPTCMIPKEDVYWVEWAEDPMEGVQRKLW
jgi:hypothetical protein